MLNEETITFVDNKADEIARGVSPNPDFPVKGSSYSDDHLGSPISSSTPEKKTVKKDKFGKSIQRSNPAHFETSKPTVTSIPDELKNIEYDFSGLNSYNVGGRGKKRKSKGRKIKKRKSKKRKSKKRKTKKRKTRKR